MPGTLSGTVNGDIDPFRPYDAGVMLALSQHDGDPTQQPFGSGGVAPPAQSVEPVVDEIDKADPPRVVMRVPGLESYQPSFADKQLVGIVFATPEQLFTGYTVPSIVVRREDSLPDLPRWHSEGALQYRVPSQQSQQATVEVAVGKFLTGPTEVEERRQAWPVDMSYSILVIARWRNDADKILRRVLRVWQPYGRVLVQDSRGEVRSYEAFMEGISPLDEVVDVSGRTVGFTVSLRISGEIDLRDPEVYRTVTSMPVTVVPK